LTDRVFVSEPVYVASCDDGSDGEDGGCTHEHDGGRGGGGKGRRDSRTIC
jgi:hypothetical protein